MTTERQQRQQREATMTEKEAAMTERERWQWWQ